MSDNYSGSHNQLPFLESSGAGYNVWKSDLELWCKITKVTAAKRGITVYLSLPKGSKAKQVASKIPHAQLESTEGIKILLQYLDAAFLPDRGMRLFNASYNLRNVVRKDDEKVTDYTERFDYAKFLLKQEGLEFHEVLLGLDLLQQCRLPQEKNHLVMSGLTDVTYETVKAKLSSIFFDDHDKLKKFEAAESGISFYAEGASGNASDEVFYTTAYGQRGRYNNFRGRYGDRSKKRPKYERGAASGYGRSNTYERGAASGYGRSNTEQPKFRTKNPIGDNGRPSKCNICESIFHWSRDCPNAYENNQPDKDNTFVPRNKRVNFNLFVAFTGYAKEGQGCKLKSLLEESKGCAIIDSGCATTVCGREWVNDFIDTLCDEDRKNIREEPSKEKFTFGDGNTVESLKKMHIPCWIQGLDRGFITTEVVESGIPLLLSKGSMKNMNMVLDFKNDTITCGGHVIYLKNTKSGHYALPLSL